MPHSPDNRSDPVGVAVVPRDVATATDGDASNAPAPDDSSRARVLVVDDVEANLVAMGGVLHGLDCEVQLVASGNDALRHLLEAEYAVVLLDVQMPGMDGYEVAHLSRQNPKTRDVPIIFLTAAHADALASDTRKSALRGYGSGAVDFLLKPVDPTILRCKVQVFLDLYTGRRQVEQASARLTQANQELKEAYRQARESQAQLVQAAKMASLGELVAGVAHEINNPLSFVCSHLDTVQRNIDKLFAGSEVPEAPNAEERQARVRTRLTDMKLGLERIRDLVLKLRTFSRLDEGHRQHASVSECIDSVLTILRHRIPEGVLVETSYREPDVIDCFPALLNQALLNVTANAVDAMTGPGTLRITAGADGGTYVIAVADEGAGIPDHLRERVLEPFFTTKPVGRGTGLGLSITYSIVKKHGGSLELISNQPSGTTVTIRLPLSPAPSPGLKQAPFG